MTLSKRLARLEAERGNGAGAMPSAIFLCDGALFEADQIAIWIPFPCRSTCTKLLARF